MTRSIQLFCLSGLVATVVVICGSRSARVPAVEAPPPRKWEYKFFQRKSEFPTEEEFNKLGGEGWELAGSMAYGGNTDRWIFKRQK